MQQINFSKNGPHIGNHDTGLLILFATFLVNMAEGDIRLFPSIIRLRFMQLLDMIESGSAIAESHIFNILTEIL